MATLPCLAVLLPSAGWAQNTNSQEGIVIGIIGDWNKEDRRLVSLGDRVRLGAKILPKAPASLTLWFEGFPPDDHYSCQQDPCKEQTITSPAPAADQSPRPQKSLLEKSFEFLFPKEPSRYFAAASRGLEGDLKEAVILLQGSQVDLAPAFADFSAGIYWVRFESIGENARNTKKAAATHVRWQPGKPALVAAEGLKTGLYRLTLSEQSGEPTGSEAWVLLRGPQEYSAASAAFQGVVNAVAAWPSGADPSAIRAVLRASLDALAAQQRGPARP